MEFSTAYLLAILEVAWVNILLSGDNAVIIALACQQLPRRRRRVGILLGSALAIALRILFAFMVTWLMATPYLKAVGGLLLLWIAVSLARGGGSARTVIARESVWQALLTIAVADTAMSLDNVVAIAAVAAGDHWLFIGGLVLSIPLIVAGATAISRLLEKNPLLLWAGAALLGWLGGGMIATDSAIQHIVAIADSRALHAGAGALGATAVVVLAALLQRRAGRRPI
jgi:YjbE family integral membrane protein